jgi:phosphate-selective porin OprO/OprP
LRRIAVLTSFLLAAPAVAQTEQPAAPPAPEPPASNQEDLQRRIDEIDQRSRIADRKLELLDEQTAASKITTPVVAAGDRGFSITSADKAYQVRIRSLVQADSRWYFADDALSLKDTFTIRKARVILDASLGGIADFRLMPDFATPAAPIQDAYGDFRPWPWLRLRVGKFKSPISLERLQNDPVVKFAERGFTSSVAPNRDIGAVLNGEVAGGVFSYAAGVMNGVTDGASADTDVNRAKDFVARVFLQPFKGDPHSRASGLGVGVAASTGIQKGNTTTPGLPSYATAGLQTFFSYLTDARDPTNTVFALRRRNRLAPQLYYYVGPFGFLAEYVASQHTISRKGELKKLTNHAWLAEASVVLTGDANGFDGVTVNEPFNPGKKTWGAPELSIRYNELRIDDDTFPSYANPTTSASLARGFGANLFWNWSRNLAWLVSFERTEFEGGAADGDRPTEFALFTRAQVYF